MFLNRFLYFVISPASRILKNLDSYILLSAQPRGFLKTLILIYVWRSSLSMILNIFLFFDDFLCLVILIKRILIKKNGVPYSKQPRHHHELKSVSVITPLNKKWIKKLAENRICSIFMQFARFNSTSPWYGIQNVQFY